MQDKMTSLITKIKLDASTEAYTFHDEEVCPTYINFFFGKNGAGKSSIADAFRHPECLEWKTGISPANYSVLIMKGCTLSTKASTATSTGMCST